jgi:hypothetical protein
VSRHLRRGLGLDCVAALLEPTEVWHNPLAAPGGSAYQRHAAFVAEHLDAVFGAYVGRREWYFLVEWGLAVAGGVCIGAAETIASGSNDDACAAAQLAAWSGVVLGAAQVALYVWLRPLRVRLELIAAAAIGALCAVGQALTAAGSLSGAFGVALAATTLELLLFVIVAAYEAFKGGRSCGALYVDNRMVRDPSHMTHPGTGQIPAESGP